MAQCHVSFDVGIRNLAVAAIVVHPPLPSVRVLKWRVIDLLERTSASKIKSVDLARRLRLLHDDCATLWASVGREPVEQTYVHIERQHARNHAMVAMAVGLFVEALHLRASAVRVAFVPAKEKLVYASRVVADIVASSDVAASRGKRNYATRKKLAIAACRALLARCSVCMADDESTPAIDYLNKRTDRRKIDDLADAMLQALARADVLLPTEAGGPTGLPPPPPPPSTRPRKRKRNGVADAPDSIA